MGTGSNRIVTMGYSGRKREGGGGGGGVPGLNFSKTVQVVETLWALGQSFVRWVKYSSRAETTGPSSGRTIGSSPTARKRAHAHAHAAHAPLWTRLVLVWRKGAFSRKGRFRSYAQQEWEWGVQPIEHCNLRFISDC